MTAVAESGAKGVRWDLTPLAPSEQVMKERLDAAVADAASFVDRWPAESLAAIEPAALAELLGELADLRAVRSEGHWWAFLLARTDGENPAVLDVQAWVDSRLPRLDEAIRHFESAWAGLPDERAEALALDDAVERDRGHLLALRRFKPFLLSPAQERALAAREGSASTAGKSLCARTVGALGTRFDDGGGERDWSLSELRGVLNGNRDRDVRRRALESIRALLEPVLPLLAQGYDAVVADRLAIDGLRGHRDPMEAANVDNQLAGSVVEQLLAATEAHYELGHRWLALKARLLGLERVDTIDLGISALPVPAIAWDEGRRLAVGAFAGLTPRLGAEAERFFAEQRIDAEPRRGKAYGAMCIRPSTRVPGFLLLNWSGNLLDLVFLTHELGHGTHFALAGEAQSDNSYWPGFAIAEVASTFAQLRLVDDLAAAGSPVARPLLAKTLDSVVGGVLNQAAYARYEQAAYATRAEGKALTADRLSELCDAELAKVWGDAMTDELECRRTMWAPLPHFVHERFYTYTYVFAFLLAATMLARSREPGFAARYERFLASGGSRSPQEQMDLLGLDLDDPGIWSDGFGVVEGWLERVAVDV